MNLATGLKEARLNVPELSGSPHADLVILDDLQPMRPDIRENDPVAETLELQDQSDPDTGYQRLGPYHPAAFNTEESILFRSSMAALHATTTLSSPDIPALSALQDLAHSIHWGVALARDTAVCQKLLSVIDPVSAAQGDVRSAATLLLGTAVHSNLDALDALLSHPSPSEAGVTPVTTVLTALRNPEQENVTLKARTVFLLSQLCQNPEQLRIFVSSGGLDTLFDLFEADKMTLDDGKDKLRAKAANFIYDVLSTLSSANGLASHSIPVISASRNDQAVIKGLEPWCKALQKALKMYETMAVSAENSSPAADAAFQSVKETNQALREAHAELGICRNESEL